MDPTWKPLQNRGYLVILVSFIMLHFVLGMWTTFLGADHPPYGADGAAYIDIIINFDRWLAERRLELRYVGKTVALGLLWLISAVLGLQKTASDLLLASKILDWLSFCLAVVVAVGVARTLKLSLGRTWLLLILTNINYASLVFSYRHPSHIDALVFLFGWLLLYFYVSGRTGALVLTVVVGALVRETILIEGFILLTLPRHTLTPHRLPPRSYAPVEAIAMGLFFAAIGIYAMWAGIPFTNTFPPLMPYGRELGLVALVIFLSLSIGGLLRWIRYEVPPVSWRRIFVVSVLAVVVIAAPRLFLYYYGSPGGGVQPGGFVVNSTLLAINGPFLSIVSHFAWAGLIVPLLVIWWPQVTKAALTLGTAFPLILCFGIISSINPETRHFIELLPFFALALVLTLPDDAITVRRLVVVFVLAFVASKVWGPFHQNDAWTMPGTDLDWKEFPRQLYYMNIGPWMRLPGFAIHLVAAILFSYALIRTFPKRRPIIPAE